MPNIFTPKRYLAALGVAVVLGVIVGLVVGLTYPSPGEIEGAVEQAKTFQATHTTPEAPDHEPIHLNGWAVALVGLVLAAIYVSQLLVRDLIDKNKRRIESNRPYRVRMLHPTRKPLKGITPCQGHWRWRGVVGRKSRTLHEIKFASPLRSYLSDRFGHHR